MSEAYAGTASEIGSGSTLAGRGQRVSVTRVVLRAYRQHPAWMLLLTVVIAAILVLAYGGYFMGWDWTGFKGNTFWDWLSLLITPVTIATISVVFSIKQAQHGMEESEIQRQESVLEAYIQQMSRLLLEEHLCDSPPDSSVRAVARAHTLATLERVGERQREVVMRFLDTSGLMAQDTPIIELPEVARIANTSERA